MVMKIIDLELLPYKSSTVSPVIHGELILVLQDSQQVES